MLEAEEKAAEASSAAAANRSSATGTGSAGDGAGECAAPAPPPPPPRFVALCGLELHHGATAMRAPDGAQWLRLTGGYASRGDSYNAGVSPAAGAAGPAALAHVAGSVGAVWHATPLPLARGFETEFRLRWLGVARAAPSGQRGGLALVLHNDPRGTLAVGCGGPGLGVGPYLRPEMEGGSCHARITPSLVLSLSARQVSLQRG